MSQHRSLRVDATRARHRNVLKRSERVHRLIELEKWNDRRSAFGLPKVKSLKIKVKKVKEPKAEAAAGAGPGQAVTPTAALAPSPEKKKAATSEKKAASGKK